MNLLVRSQVVARTSCFDGNSGCQQGAPEITVIDPTATPIDPDPTAATCSDT